MPRKQHTYHYIYKITCNVNGKYYIGMHSTSNLEDGYFGSGKRLKYSIYKHGKENHLMEILDWLPDRSSLKIRESELVNETLLTDPMCMNLQLGGFGGLSGIDHLSKFREGNKKWLSEKWNDLEYLKRHKDLHSKILKSRHDQGQIRYDTFTGKSHTNSTKLKIGKANSISQCGEKNSQFGTKWISHPILGSKKIKQQDVNTMLNQGWHLGRKYSDE